MQMTTRNRASFIKALANALHNTIAIVIIGIIAIVVATSCGTVRTHAGIEHEFSHDFDRGYYYDHGYHHGHHKHHKKHKKHHKHHHHDDDAIMMAQ